ncbi:hypothetical protein AL544_002705 [Vibrio mimicus]|uniref:Uncharacterized protein n=1 Tax=Vibrio mimicus TaxID=674 RepID=A0A2J9VJA7_VIBMI|nr:hypothetical protein AL544_002705 [Vibrio mimicus]
MNPNPRSSTQRRIFPFIYSPVFTLRHNAQLRGEQRLHTNLKHCAINTKTEVEAKVPSVVNPS